MDKRYTVFVSSTFKDLVDARWAVARALMRLNLIPLGMENFTASDKSQWEIIKKTIDLSDYYVLILGNCYGSIDPETGISYTEKEYRYALEQGIPCLTFISKDVPIKPEHQESDKNRKKLDALRAEASAGRMVDFWASSDELTAKVATALVMSQMDTPRPGWVRNPQTSPEIAEEVARLSRENAMLRHQISKTGDEFNDLINYLKNYRLFDGEIGKVNSNSLFSLFKYLFYGNSETSLEKIFSYISSISGKAEVWEMEKALGLIIKLENLDLLTSGTRNGKILPYLIDGHLIRDFNVSLGMTGKQLMRKIILVTPDEELTVTGSDM